MLDMGSEPQIQPKAMHVSPLMEMKSTWCEASPPYFLGSPNCQASVEKLSALQNQSANIMPRLMGGDP